MMYAPRSTIIQAVERCIQRYGIRKTTADCHANINLTKIEAQRDRMVQLFASAHSGHTSAINALARYGSAARGKSAV